MKKKLILFVLITLSVLSSGEILSAKIKPFEKDSPIISFDKLKFEYAGTDDHFIVFVRGIKIVPPKINTKDTFHKTEISCDIKINEDDVKVDGFSLGGNPSISKDGETYTVSFPLSGKIPSSSRRVVGKVYFKVGAIAKDPKSGKLTKRAEHGTEIDIDFRPLKK
jgi:hypothetical protein